MSDDAPEFDFEHDLPAGVETFALHWLANRWRCSVMHLFRLVEAGEFNDPKKGAPVDLRNAQSSKAMIRVPRAAVVSFLNRRKDLDAVAEANPKPPPRPEQSGKRKAKKAVA